MKGNTPTFTATLFNCEPTGKPNKYLVTFTDKATRKPYKGYILNTDIASKAMNGNTSERIKCVKKVLEDYGIIHDKIEIEA